MVFSSTIFLFAFFPCLMLFYFLSADRYKNVVLLAFSLVFYAWGEPKFVFVMVLEVAVDYVAALLIERFRERRGWARLCLILALSANLGLLMYYKYFGFILKNAAALLRADIAIPSIVMPIGISFFTFQALSYVIDVYRGQVAAQKKFTYVLLYVSLFPQLVAGPIVRYSTVEKEIAERRSTREDIAQGLARMTLGLCKKLVIANNMGQMADQLYGGPALVMPTAWLAAIAYTLQIYFDFSAYSDMAIGLGRIFGFHFEENFRFPYIATSITEFWRRWHISLSTWFRDYLYIPLGGSRRGKLYNVFTLFVVWFATGLWHGAAWNFILWGLYYFVLLVLEKFVLRDLLARLPSWLRRVYTLAAVVFGWVLFRAESLRGCYVAVKAMLLPRVSGLGMDLFWMMIGKFGLYLILGIVFSMPVYDLVAAKIRARVRTPKGETLAAGLHYALMLGLFFVSVLFLVSSTYNPFIYFRF